MYRDEGCSDDPRVHDQTGYENAGRQRRHDALTLVLGFRAPSPAGEGTKGPKGPPIPGE
jgi:hypothetical protein